jgi:hypothetical protein
MAIIEISYVICVRGGKMISKVNKRVKNLR